MKNEQVNQSFIAPKSAKLQYNVFNDLGIYVRVSTEEQAQHGYSIMAQIDKLTSYAEIRNWHIYDIYKDEGRSGKSIEGRTELQRLITDIEAGKVKNVLVFKIDRLTRSVKDLIELVDIFNKYDCAFNSLVEAIDTHSATGRMFIKILGIFAEFERENLVERLQAAFERKAKEGYSNCLCTPSYGYKRDLGAKVQDIVPEEAAIVREIYNLFLHDDYTMTQIATMLNLRKVPSKKGLLWNSKTVRLILTNVNYIGQVRYSVNNKDKYFEADGKHEAIIDEKTFYAVRHKLNMRKGASHIKRAKEDAYYSGILTCGECGEWYSPKRNYKRGADNKTKVISTSYRCINKVKGVCKAHTICHKKIDEAFENYIQNIADLTYYDEKDLISERRIDTIKSEINSINITINGYKSRQKEIMNLYVMQEIDFQRYREMMLSIDEKIKTAENLISDLEFKLNQDDIITEEHIIRNFKENWVVLNNSERMRFMQKFIKSIVIDIVKIEGEHYNTVNIREVIFNI